jgi:hypothetical protein
MKPVILLDLNTCPTAKIFEAKQLIREELHRRQNAFAAQLAAAIAAEQEREATEGTETNG